MKIGELARRAGCPVETVRYYEREGLLPEPARTDGNYRIYTDAHLARLGFVRHCRSLDMTHDEIRRLLRLFDDDQPDLDGAEAVLDEHIGHVAARIAELKDLQTQLKQLRALCRQAVKQGEQGIDMLQGLNRSVDTRWPDQQCGYHPHGGLSRTHRGST